jgi:hypothetical protein
MVQGERRRRRSGRRWVRRMDRARIRFRVSIPVGGCVHSHTAAVPQQRIPHNIWDTERAGRVLTCTNLDVLPVERLYMRPQAVLEKPG